ncbi:Rid family hydrolase [Lysobacter sp. CA196]|uniref:Rid family hydrolase n=1 Tax=Lysobacter sp. CA196 TaxID=3455606 RepID=UPI003F8D787A
MLELSRGLLLRGLLSQGLLSRGLVLAVLAACSGAALAQSAAAPSREHFAPKGWEGSYHGLHYSPVVKIGDRVIVSGIPAMEGADDEARARWVFQQLEAHLRSAGASLADVVELQSFHVAADHAEFRRRIDPVLKVHREFFKDHYPAWTAVATPGLFSKDASFELRAEAVIGSGSRPKAEIAKPAER